MPDFKVCTLCVYGTCNKSTCYPHTDSRQLKLGPLKQVILSEQQVSRSLGGVRSLGPQLAVESEEVGRCSIPIS
jgi:hypothetical protein